MEYPILPGSVISSDVEYVGQRAHQQRPNVVERQVQYVDRIPMQRSYGYQQMPGMVQSNPAYQPPPVQPYVQQVPIAASYAVPVAAPVAAPIPKLKSERCCTTRVTIVVSVLIVCLLIGAAVGVGLYLQYGTANANDSDTDDVTENGDANNPTSCIVIDPDMIPVHADKPSSNENDDDDDHEKDGDDDDDDDDDDKDDKDERKRPHGNGGDKDKDKDRPSKHDDGEKDDDHHGWIGQIFHWGNHVFSGMENGNITLENCTEFFIYDSNGIAHQHDNTGYWIQNDDDNVPQWIDTDSIYEDPLPLCDF